MKQKIVLASLLGFFLQVTTVSAQMAINVTDPNETQKMEPIDNLQFIAQYQIKFIPDSLHPEKILDETMMLKVGTKSSMYYSYTRFITDSLFREELKKNGGRVIRQGPQDRNEGLITYKIYKNYPAGKVTTLDQIATSRFRCEEENERPDWELLPDTMTILSYSCQKAVCHFRGRDYEAWFTSEIPRSDGPWKLHGLPGLILRAADNRNHYVFECSGIEQSHSDDSLLFGAERYEPVSRKNLNKIYERFAKDPMGYVASTSPNVKIMVMDADGSPAKMKDMPYNPIELEEK
ncbi:MAG: GLPGLI family protein [Tannerella sp.]|jgi:GLPGLI family protein|nr:GLPGLI family protein [Tannerella sp.]